MGVAAERFHMIIGSVADDATVTIETGSVDGTMVLNHLLTDNPEEVARFTPAGDIVKLRVDLASADVLGGVGLSWDRIAGALDYQATVRIEAYDAVGGSDGVGEQVYDSGEQAIDRIIPIGALKLGVHAWGQTYGQISTLPPMFTHWTDPVAYRSLDITITTSDDTFDLWRLVVGDAFIPKVNYSWGYRFMSVNRTEYTRTAGGALQGKARDDKRVFRVPFDYFDDSDAERYYHLKHVAGPDASVLVALDPGKEGVLGIAQQMNALITSDIDFNHEYLNNQKLELVLEEI